MLPAADDLVYFLEVAQTLNISRAAERLGIRQPSLSLAVRRLEDSVGTRLFVRTKTGVTLTRAGQKLVVQSRELLSKWQDLRNEVLKSETSVRGRFVIASHVSVALYSLPGFVAKLLKDHPQLEFTLVHDLSRKMTEEVISFKADFGIVVNPVEHPDLVIKEIARDEVTLWRGIRLHAPDVLICDPDLIQTQHIHRQLERQSLRFARTIHSPSLEVITALVASGAGVGILPKRVATRLKSQQLKLFSPTEAPKYPDRICLIYRADTQKSQASRSILEAIRANFGAAAPKNLD